MKAYWHGYHDSLLMFSDNVQERIDYIKANKPKHERELRLRLLKEVQGELPATVIEAGAAVVKACTAYDKAWAAYNEAARNKARVAREKAWLAYNKAGVAHSDACVAYNKAGVAYYKAVADNLPAIEALHAQECPGCPWDGETIFPRRG